MRFDIVLAPEAVADLKRLKADDRTAIRAALEIHLRHEPRKVEITAAVEVRKSRYGHG